MGAIPGLPKVHLHNPVLAYEVGDEFMQYWHLADEGRLDAPFVLVIEGSIPNEQIKSEGYWAALSSCRSWTNRLAESCPPAWSARTAGSSAGCIDHQHHGQQGTQVAAQQADADRRL